MVVNTQIDGEILDLNLKSSEDLICLKYLSTI